MLLKKYFFKLLLLLLFMLAMFNISAIKTFRSKIHDFYGTIYSFISYPLYYSQNKYNEIRNYWFTFKESKNIYLENKRLKEEAQNLELIKHENEALKQLVNFRNNFRNIKVTGRVVLESNENFNKQYLINVGLQNGVRRGNAVVSNNKLVGRVIEVGNISSKIQILTDASSKIPVTILGTHYSCVAVGISKKEYLKLIYLPDDIKIANGQIVVTSGEGRYMPHGVYVGKIVNKDKEIYVKTDIKNNQMLGLVSILTLKENF